MPFHFQHGRGRRSGDHLEHQRHRSSRTQEPYDDFAEQRRLCCEEVAQGVDVAAAMKEASWHGRASVAKRCPRKQHAVTARVVAQFCETRPTGHQHQRWCPSSWSMANSYSISSSASSNSPSRATGSLHRTARARSFAPSHESCRVREAGELDRSAVAYGAADVHDKRHPTPPHQAAPMICDRTGRQESAPEGVALEWLATPMGLDRADERVGVAGALGHPLGPPRDEVRQRSGVPPERNAATLVALGDRGADTQVRPRTGQTCRPMGDRRSPRHAGRSSRPSEGSPGSAAIGRNAPRRHAARHGLARQIKVTLSDWIVRPLYWARDFGELRRAKFQGHRPCEPVNDVPMLRSTTGGSTSDSCPIGCG